MDNYTAIIKMSLDHLAVFLDEVYCTGLNNGMWVARQSEQDDPILDVNP